MAKTLYDLALDYLNQGMPDITQAPRTTSQATTSSGTTTNPTDYFNLPVINTLPSPSDDGGITSIPNNITNTPQPGNTAEQQRLIDTGIGTQLKPGSPISSIYEGMPQTQQQMDDFNAIPVNREYGDEMNIGYGEGQVDPQLAAAVGGKDNTLLGNSNLVTTSSGDVFAADDPMLEEKIDFKTPQQTGAINNVFNNAKNLGTAGIDNLRDGLTALGGKVVGGLDNVIEIGGKTIDLGKSLAGGALSYMTGIPGLGLAALQALPERDPRQNALDELYDVEDGTIQSGLMQGYNPVSGNPLDPNFGLQDAYQKRIDTIEETIARKSDADENYDPTELQNRINQLEIDKAKEADILNLYEGDINPEGTGDGSIAEKIEETNRLGIPSDIGVEGENEGRFSDPSPLPIDILPQLSNEFTGPDYEGMGSIGSGGINNIAGVDSIPQDLQSNSSALGDSLLAELNEILGNNTTDDSTLVAGSVNENIKNNYQNQLDTLIERKERDADLGLPSGQYDKAIERLNDAIDKIEFKEIDGQTAGLLTMNDAIKNAATQKESDAAAVAAAAREQAIAEETANRNAAREAAAAKAEADRIEADRIAEVARENEARRQAEINRLAAEASARKAREAAYRRANQSDSGGGGGGGGFNSSNSSGYDSGNFCFDPSTLIQMADGSTKKIKNIQLGDDTKGGEVTGVFQFKASDEIHDYKGVTVAGSHYVKENGKFIMVKDSPLSVKIDKIPVVYSLDTTGRRIFINDIEFADYNGDGVAKNFLTNAGVDLTGFDTEVLRQVEQRLI